jgi:hypothetical protein
MKLSNIYRSIVTTTLGFIIIGISLYSVVQHQFTWIDTVIGLGLGLSLLFAPDSVLDSLLNKLKSDKDAE